MATLNELRDKLCEVDELVFYGMVDRNKVTDRWNYTVFGRRVMRPTGNKTGFADVYTVAIVREDYIPEGYEQTVIDKVCEISGMRLSDGDMQYSYTQKPNTNTVVELLELVFIKPKKRVI